jgi:hypothetical protein
MVWASSRGTGHARTDTDHSGWPEAPTIVALGQPSRLVVYHRRHPLVVPLKTTPNSSGGSGMPLYRLLRENAFDQADVDRMVAAYEAALSLLKLKNREDPICELVANRDYPQWRARPAAHLCPCSHGAWCNVA